MVPLGPRLAVKRGVGERALAWGLVLPAPDSRDSYCGEVIAAGDPHRVRNKRLPLEVKAGDRIVYSSRVDCFKVGDDDIDIVEENSVIGVLA
jgi:co-chaperonin GroES (HSP10)